MQYTDIKKPELIKGIKFWQNPKNKFYVAMLHYSADPHKDPDRDGKEWYNSEKEGTLKATWQKEYEIDFTTKSGKLVYGQDYCDFSPNIHLINSFEWPEPAELILGLDFGQRNPTCALVGVWTMDNVLYIVDEYYKPAIPSISSREMFKQFEYLFPGGDLYNKSIREKRFLAYSVFPTRVIDPTTRSKNRTTVKDGEEIPYSVIEEFYDNGWDFEPANNDVSAGITRVREYFKLDNRGKSHLYIFKDKCPNLCWELQNYRYKELSEEQKKSRNESEDVVKKDDHAVDTLKYIILTRPNTPVKDTVEKTRIQKDIENLIKQRPSIISDWDNN